MSTRKVQLCSLLTITLLSMLLAGCGGSGEPQTNDPPETVTDTRTITVTTSGGGNATLGDGTVFTVPAGATTVDGTLTVRTLANAATFHAASQHVYEVDTTALPATFTLLLPNSTGEQAADVAAALYDPALTSDGMDAEMPVTMTANGLVVTYSSRSRHSREINRGGCKRILVDRPLPLTSPMTDHLLRLPYYEQTVDGACVPDSATMIARMYGYNGEVIDFARLLGYHSTDFGVDWQLTPKQFRTILQPILATQTGHTVNVDDYYSKESVKRRWIELINVGHPVLAFTPGHALVVVGYRTSPELTFIVHDGKGGPFTSAVGADGKFVLESNMYGLIKWADMLKKFNMNTSFVDYFPQMWVDAELPTTTSRLYTMGIPNATDGGQIAFRKLGPTGKPIDCNLVWNVTQPGGTSWNTTQGIVTTIPTDVVNFIAHIAVWNATDTTANLDVELTIACMSASGAGTTINKTLSVNTNSVAPGGYRKPDFADFDIPIGDIFALAPTQAETAVNYSLKVRLLDHSTEVDSFSTTFAIAPPGLEVTPDKQWTEETVAINGQGFGTTAGSVKFYNKAGTTSAGDIYSWSDTRIVVYVPVDAVDGILDITTKLGKTIITKKLTIIEPTITSVMPSSAPPGTLLRLVGENFIKYDGGHTHYLSGTILVNGTTLPPEAVWSWNNTQIDVRLPVTSPPGDVKIAVCLGPRTGKEFTYTATSTVWAETKLCSHFSMRSTLYSKHPDGTGSTTIMKGFPSGSTTTITWTGLNFEITDGTNTCSGRLSQTLPMLETLTQSGIYSSGNYQESWSITYKNVPLAQYTPPYDGNKRWAVFSLPSANVDASVTGFTYTTSNGNYVLDSTSAGERKLEVTFLE